jgi:ParB family transcriptional regulator, chromosome partitioning protein
MNQTTTTRKPLGRGLSALLSIPDEGGAGAADKQQTLNLSATKPNPGQPRQRFAPQELHNLAESIKEQGILQPILVRPRRHGEYEIVAGERRWRAAAIAGLTEVPVIIKDLTDASALEIALVENVQREDLTPLEEAECYQKLIRDFQYTQETLAQKIGKSRSYISNQIRLLQLPEPVKEIIKLHNLSAGHARTLINAPDPEALARTIINESLTVRNAENLAQHQKAHPKRQAVRLPDITLTALGKQLQGMFALPVSVHSHADGGGYIKIHFHTAHDLDAFITRLQ